MTQYLEIPQVTPPESTARVITLFDDVATLEEVKTTNFLKPQQVKGHVFYEKDTIFIKYVGGQGFFKLSIDSQDSITLSEMTPTVIVQPATAGNVLIVGEDTTTAEDSEIPSNSLLTTNTIVDDYEQFVGLSNIIYTTGGTWAITQEDLGLYSYAKTPGADTSVIAFDITPQIRRAASKGFQLSAISVVTRILAQDLIAHSGFLGLIVFIVDQPPQLISIPTLNSLPIIVNTEPYISTLPIATPFWDNTPNSKFTFELSVNAQASTEYALYGLNLSYIKTVA